MSHILLGVTGSIAAYKAAELANELTKRGHEVHVIMTAAATEFITPLTFQTLTKQPVYTGQFEVYDPAEVTHIALAQRADLALIAPATANFLAKAAAGLADDLLTSALLAVENKPVLICPAMNDAMYRNPVTQRNIRTLRELGFRFVEPREGHLACGGVGKGALAGTEVILDAVSALLDA